MTKQLPLGPVIAAVDGLQLEAIDRERLVHPLVGGVTLFARNFSDAEQVTKLCNEIHGLREPRLLICVDQEGGRVQRFRDGFTRLPPMRRIGELWDKDPAAAIAAARAAGHIIAAELGQCDVDVSFAPVLDLDHGASTIIGDRAFHSDPEVVVALAGALLDGFHAGGMVGVGKHFPGHGFIAADSHLELPIDERSGEEIAAFDLFPFRALAPKLAGIMPAHVLYPAVDDRPAGFSRHWLQEVLRRQCGYTGAIFSDDLGMQGAAGEGSLAARATAAFEAGCDLVLACTTQDVDNLLDELRIDVPVASRTRLAAMFGMAARRPRPGQPKGAEVLAAQSLLRMLET